MALLAAYRANKTEGQTLEAYLNEKVFASAKSATIVPQAEDVAGINAYTDKFVACLDAEKAAVEKLN